MSTLYYETDSNSLTHYGVPGMKWGVRKSHKSTSLRAIIARKKNEKVDKSFKKWNEQVKNRDNAIELGKKMTLSKMAYMNNKNDKNLKAEYKKDNREYEKAIRKNTTYRKGVVKQEVGRFAARKYLSDAKKVKKELAKNPGDKKLQKKYDELMSAHDIERARARRATEVSGKRSRLKASIKRKSTMTLKAAVATTAITTGLYATNKYLNKRQVTLNGMPVRVSNANVSMVTDFIKKGKDILGYI